MPKITEEPLEAIQVRLFKSDLDYLRSFYKGSSEFNVNKWIRQTVRSGIREAQAKSDRAINESERPRPEGNGDEAA